MKATLLCLLVVSIGFYSCRSTTSPLSSGSVAGRVILFDSNYAPLTDLSGVLVHVDGSSIAAVTDPLGAWKLTGISEGLHDITATKAGYGTYHWYEQNINAGNLDVGTVALAQMPSFTPVINGVGYFGSTLSFWVKGAYDSLPPHVEAAGYCDLDSTVQPSDPHLLVALNTDSRSGGGIYFGRVDLIAAGVRPGQTLYFSSSNVFVRDTDNYSVASYSTIFGDPAHNHQHRFASTGPKSNVIAVTMP